ncbi:MAG: hypothetical protein IJF41_05635 [Clostridia bacterium]|nr:hypothetical protein [Clostridia bacterium]
MAKPAAILDVGSSKLVCLVGSQTRDQGLAVHGAAVCSYEGFSEEGFFEGEEFRKKVIEAVQRAEQESRVRIREIGISVPAAFTRLALTEAEVPVASRSRKVSGQDVDELIGEALQKSPVKDAVLMHSTPVSFLVNGRVSAEVPRGERADSIGGTVSHMYVEQNFVEAMEAALAPIHVEVSMCMSGALGAALAIIPEAERVRPAVLIDVGYETTEVAVIENAALTGLETIPSGGKHFVSDLSFGLDIPLHYAEIVKRRYVFNQEPLSPTEIIRMPNNHKRVEHKVISLIMEARAKELSELIRQALNKLGITPESYPVTYLTGGGLTMVKGGADYLKQALHLPVKRDIPYLPEMDTPNFTSAFGALDFTLRAVSRVYGEIEEPVSMGVMDKLKEFFNK